MPPTGKKRENKAEENEGEDKLKQEKRSRMEGKGEREDQDQDEGDIEKTVSIPEEMLDFIVPDDEEEEDEEDTDETEDDTDEGEDEGEDEEKGEKGETNRKELEEEDESLLSGIDASNLIESTSNGVCSRSRRNVRPPQRLVDEMTSTKWYKEQVMVDVGTSEEEIAYALEDENWTEEEEEGSEEEEGEEESGEEEETAEEEEGEKGKEGKKELPVSKGKVAKHGRKG